MRGFVELIEQLRKDAQTLGPAEFVAQILEKTGYLEMLEQRGTAEDASRADNLRELVNAVAEGADDGQTLIDLLDRTALVAASRRGDIDATDRDDPGFGCL